MVVLKLRGARQRMRTREGRCEGRKPYGQTEQERAAMARMRTLRGSGLHFAEVAAQMNSESIPTRTGGAWHGGTISKIVARVEQTRICA